MPFRGRRAVSKFTSIICFEELKSSVFIVASRALLYTENYLNSNYTRIEGEIGFVKQHPNLLFSETKISSTQ